MGLKDTQSSSAGGKSRSRLNVPQFTCYKPSNSESAGVENGAGARDRDIGHAWDLAGRRRNPVLARPSLALRDHTLADPKAKA